MSEIEWLKRGAAALRDANRAIADANREIARLEKELANLRKRTAAGCGRCKSALAEDPTGTLLAKIVSGLPGEEQ